MLHRGNQLLLLGDVFLKGRNLLLQRIDFDAIALLCGGQLLLQLIELQVGRGQLRLEFVYTPLLSLVLNSQVLQLRVATADQEDTGTHNKNR